jgi:hypothetical protein
MIIDAHAGLLVFRERGQSVRADVARQQAAVEPANAIIPLMLAFLRAHWSIAREVGQSA